VNFNWNILKLQIVSLGGLLFLSLSITWVILYYVRLLDHPNERSSHFQATPKCGGVGIVTSFVTGVLLSQGWGGRYVVGQRELSAMVVPLLLVAVVSLLDDIRELPTLFRLLVQVAAALLFLSLLGGTGQVNGGGWVCPEAWFYWLTASVWIVGLANAVNFMDGIDGIAAGQGLIAAFFFGIVQFSTGDYYLGYLSFVLVVGCLGFLAFNFPPAKVFMGDVGSVSIGFILATMSLSAWSKSHSVSALILMPLLMANFIFDTVFTLVRRLARRENIFKAHRSHLYQQFAQCGFSQRTVTMTNFGMAITQGMVVLLAGNKIMLPIGACLGLQLGYAWWVKNRMALSRRNNIS